MGFGRIGRKGVLSRRMWLAEGCGGRRRATATPKWESCKEKEEEMLKSQAKGRRIESKFILTIST